MLGGGRNYVPGMPFIVFGFELSPVAYASKLVFEMVVRVLDSLNTPDREVICSL